MYFIHDHDEIKPQSERYIVALYFSFSCRLFWVSKLKFMVVITKYLLTRKLTRTCMSMTGSYHPHRSSYAIQFEFLLHIFFWDQESRSKHISQSPTNWVRMHLWLQIQVAFDFMHGWKYSNFHPAGADPSPLTISQPICVWTCFFVLCIFVFCDVIWFMCIHLRWSWTQPPKHTHTRHEIPYEHSSCIYGRLYAQLRSISIYVRCYGDSAFFRRRHRRRCCCSRNERTL